MQAVDYDIPIADRLEGLLQPYENGLFVGQDAAEKRLEKQVLPFVWHVP